MERDVDEGFNKILTLLHQQTGVDFSQYRPATLRRRIERRMQAGKVGSFKDYCRYLRVRRNEAKELFHDLLIPVTNFFRDPSVFKALKDEYLPKLLKEKAGGPIRIWVPACSTGEELYSLAIILAEIIESKKTVMEAQIFGTDLNESALEKARSGFYPQSIRKQVSAERLSRFFEAARGGFAVRKQIRDLCVFARHNLAADPPFSNLDLVSCRNALIYMSPQLQSKIIAIFHFSLKPDGLLLLGPSETIGALSDSFVTENRKINLFRRCAKVGKNGRVKLLPPTPAVHHSAEDAWRAATAGLRKLDPSRLRAAMQKVIERTEGMAGMDSNVVPITIPKTGDKAYLVFGAPEDEATANARSPGKAKHPELENVRLRREIFHVQKSVKGIVEQQEAMNEELRAANEEIISSNEELQSTNEELEMAKEELQASNEELATLNTELENRNTELERVNLIASHFQALVDSSDDAIITKDLNGIIQTWNKAAEKMFGYTPEEVIGKPVTILFPPELVHEESHILARLRAGDRIEHYETVRRRKDGTLLDISLTISPVINAAGQITSASKIARDITERKRAEAAVKKARDEAEQANRIKDDFLATLSHELRTPLNPVLLVASEAASDPELSPGIRANFDIIRRNVELEARLIDDLLDLVRVRTGKLKVEKRLVNVHAVLTATVAIVQNEIEQKRITLTQKINDRQSVIAGDTVRLQQVFWNVLKNAVKFTPPGGKITIETSTTRENCTVKISDSGIGMSPRELSHVFDPFKQGEHSEDAHRFGGLGLGLAITKNLVGLHGGTIKATSTGPGKGSLFTITFPLAEWNEKDYKRPRAAGQSQAPGKLAGLRILLVDDHEPTRSALEKLLTNRRHKVTVAGSVGEAMSAGKKSAFDLVISDIGLPDGTGHDLFKKLRKFSPKAKGIALTGYGMDKDVANSRESGFAAHLTKPVRIDALDAALAGVLN